MDVLVTIFSFEHIFFPLISFLNYDKKRKSNFNKLLRESEVHTLVELCIVMYLFDKSSIFICI